jgi:hypothetical protein
LFSSIIEWLEFSPGSVESGKIRYSLNHEIVGMLAGVFLKIPSDLSYRLLFQPFLDDSFNITI